MNTENALRVATTATAAPARKTQSGPQLSLIKTPATGAGLAPWLLGYVGILLGALVGVLGLNMAMVSTAYDVHRVEKEITTLNEKHETLKEQVLEASSPNQLESKARSYGMVPAKTVAMINLHTSTITDLGVKDKK